MTVNNHKKDLHRLKKHIAAHIPSDKKKTTFGCEKFFN